MNDSQNKTLRRFLRRLHGSPSSGEVPDHQLLTCFVQERDEAAFELLLRRYECLVWGVCRRMSADHQQAEDAFQATFLTFAQKADTIRECHSLGGWLSRVAYRVALRAHRRRRVPSLESHGIDPLDDNANLEASALHREELSLLDEELDKLPDQQRLPVILCYLQGKTYTEAAQQLNWPVGTVATRLTQARDRLHKRLTSRGVTLLAAFATGVVGQSVQATSPEILSRTFQACMSVTQGNALSAGAVSTTALSLSEEVIQTMSMSKVKKVLLGLCCFLMMSTAMAYGVYAFVQTPSPTQPGANPTEPQADVPPPVRKRHPLAVDVAPWVAVAELKRASLKGVDESFPPTYIYSLDLEMVLPIDAPLKKGQRFQCEHSVHQVKEPKLPQGKQCLVKFTSRGNSYVALSLSVVTPKQIREAERVAKEAREKENAFRKDLSKHPRFAAFREADGVMVTADGPPEGTVEFTPGADNAADSDVVSLDLICVKSLRGKIQPKTINRVYYRGQGKKQPVLPLGERWVVTYHFERGKCVLTTVDTATDLILSVAEAAVRKGTAK